jgi:putative ABC transport system ATP-binding protein
MDDATEQQEAISARTPVLQAVDLERRAGERVLLNGASVKIHGGDRIVIVGPTGSGKTLLLRSLAMLDPLDAGEIRWHGRAVRRNEIPRFRARVLYLHQRPALLEGTVEDNLRQPFTLKVHDGKEFFRPRIVELLASLERDESFLSKLQRDLSGGESQFTALLRALQLDPEVLLLDEPTAALDADATAGVEVLLTRWLDEQPKARAVVWVTHNQDQARRVATSMVHIREGRLTGGVDERVC